MRDGGEGVVRRRPTRARHDGRVASRARRAMRARVPLAHDLGVDRCARHRGGAASVKRRWRLRSRHRPVSPKKIPSVLITRTLARQSRARRGVDADSQTQTSQDAAGNPARDLGDARGASSRGLPPRAPSARPALQRPTTTRSFLSISRPTLRPPPRSRRRRSGPRGRSTPRSRARAMPKRSRC
jgi:hypothetical protein